MTRTTLALASLSLLALAVTACGREVSGPSTQATGPRGVVFVSGNAQRASESGALPEPLVLRTYDETGQPRGNVRVRITIDSGAAEVAEFVTTDVQGFAQLPLRVLSDKGVRGRVATDDGTEAVFAAAASNGPSLAATACFAGAGSGSEPDFYAVRLIAGQDATIGVVVYDGTYAGLSGVTVYLQPVTGRTGAYPDSLVTGANGVATFQLTPPSSIAAEYLEMYGFTLNCRLSILTAPAHIQNGNPYLAPWYPTKYNRNASVLEAGVSDVIGISAWADSAVVTASGATAFPSKLFRSGGPTSLLTGSIRVTMGAGPVARVTIALPHRPPQEIALASPNAPALTQLTGTWATSWSFDRASTGLYGEKLFWRRRLVLSQIADRITGYMEVDSILEGDRYFAVSSILPLVGTPTAINSGSYSSYFTYRFQRLMMLSGVQSGRYALLTAFDNGVPKNFIRLVQVSADTMIGVWGISSASYSNYSYDLENIMLVRP